MDTDQNSTPDTTPTPLSQKVTVLLSATLGIIVAGALALPKLRIIRESEDVDSPSETPES